MLSSSSADNSNYIILEGLSIEVTDSGNEVFFTPDIHINKNLSMTSVASSIYGDTGAPDIKHLHTFSREESEKDEIDLSNLSICSTEEEEPMKRDINTNNHHVAHVFDFDEEDIENNDPSSRYRRQRDSFRKPSANFKNQHEIMNVVRSIVPPIDTHVNELVQKELDPRSPRSRVLGDLCVNSPQNANVETERDVAKVHLFSADVVIPKELDPRSPINSRKEVREGGDVKFSPLPIDTTNNTRSEREPETRSPRVLGELKMNSPQNSLVKMKRSGRNVDVKQKIRGWENYVLSSGLLPAPLDDV